MGIHRHFEKNFGKEIIFCARVKKVLEK